MLSNANKRPASCELELTVDDCIDNGKCFKVANSDNGADVEDINTKKTVYTQNINPALAMYHCDGNASSTISWTQLQHLLNPDEKDTLYDFLTTHGLIATHQQCEFCGAYMKRVRENGTLLSVVG